MNNDNKEINVSDCLIRDDLTQLESFGVTIKGVETHMFYLPLFVMIPRKTKADKRISLNLNVYRNLHPMVNNQVKQLFKPIQGEKFKAEKIRISYYVEKKMKRLFDTKNITTVVDKFFCDWLVKNGCIPDDNFMNVCYGSEDGTMGCVTDRVIATVEVLG